MELSINMSLLLISMCSPISLVICLGRYIASRHAPFAPCQIPCQNMPGDMQLYCVLLWRYSF
ncbi:putative signal peptide protein [Puccinia sorghi]|uniref:Putative signal peptide protein n=1 Tax=Puccinia sorghi TaxID=27349 RepID=A0A0L6U7C0_9BASI|nr:putative signal peptide protein [Puccinia sorghi]